MPSLSAITTKQATRATDPLGYWLFRALPNPDPILRKLGVAQDVYSAISYDAHVIGELQAVRSELIGYERRLQAGGESRADKKALALCEQVFQGRPVETLSWNDISWSVAQAKFFGISVAEVTWTREGGYLLPMVEDRRQGRFVFDPDGRLRLLTRSAPSEGIETGPYKWLLARHMASYDNPYGVAVFSACFWPYSFKHGGWRYFARFCERYGLPWPIGRYPPGTSPSDQGALADKLAEMIEESVAVIPEGSGVELLETKSGGSALPQERLIDLCNRELSKALTSQTLATEIQGAGSRAASQTHREREQGVGASLRELVSDAYSQLCAWITEINIPNARPPTFEFYQEEEARADWVEVLEKARAFVQIPAAWAHARLQIPEPKGAEVVLPGVKPEGAKEWAGKPPDAASFSARQARTSEGQMDIDAMAASDPGFQGIMQTLLQPIFQAMENGLTPEAILGKLADWYPKLDGQELTELLARAMFIADLRGRMEAKAGE